MRAITATVAAVAAVLLVWMQAVASVSPHVIEMTAACQCCRCGNPACATQTAVPAPAPSLAAVQPSISKEERTSPPVRVALPPAPVASVDGLPASTDVCLPALPSILRRHGVLRI